MTKTYSVSKVIDLPVGMGQEKSFALDFGVAGNDKVVDGSLHIMAQVTGIYKSSSQTVFSLSSPGPDLNSICPLPRREVC